MKILLSLVALFIVIFNAFTSTEAECTPEKIRGCCILLCIDPYCDSATGSCKCGNAQLSKTQCSFAEGKCPNDKINSCCTKRCKSPYCDLKTGSCDCGDDELSTSQCSSK